MMLQISRMAAQASSYILYFPVGLAVVFLITQWRKTRLNFPCINSYPWDLGRRKAIQEYMENATNLVAQGLAKFQGPFLIHTPIGPRLVLPSSYMDWAKNCSDVDHQQLVREDFFADFSGFEGLKFVTNPNSILIDLVRIKLSRNAGSIPIMNQHLEDVLRETWTDNKEWHILDWPQDTMKIISRMSASVFVGPRLARDQEWQKLTVTYTMNVFAAVAALRRWPAFMRPFVHQWLSGSKTCRKQVRLTSHIIKTELDQRSSEQRIATAEEHFAIKFDDCISWTEEIAAGRPYNPAAAQLALVVSALHTTSEAFRQVLLDLCQHQDLIEPLRDEIKTVLSETSLNLAALAKLELLDSVMKESQRFASASVGVERKVTRDTTLPNGIVIPRGTNIAIDSGDMWSADVHENPQTFDGCRFLNMKRKGKGAMAAASFVSSTREHNTFGAGKFICPGRFFVANEMKLALVHILLKYDVRLQDGQNPRSLRSGFYGMTDLEAKVEVRRRSEYPDQIE